MIITINRQEHSIQMDRPQPQTLRPRKYSNSMLPTPPQKPFSIIKNIDNCNLTVPTTDSTHKYYQIAIPDGPTLRIYFMTHSVIRVRVCFDRNPMFLEQSYSLVMTAWDDRLDEVFKGYRKRVKPLVNVNFEEMQSETDGKYYYFETNQLNGKIYKNPYGLQIFNKSGVSIYKDLRGRAFKRDIQGRIYHYNQIDSTNDCFYGFGENTGKLNKAGCRIRLAPQDALGYDAETSSPLYKHIPFYIKINQKYKHAIGLFYNNTYETTFDMGSERSGYWPRYSYYTADGGDVDLFIINGPSMKRVIQRYTDLTGKTALAPIQSLGYLGSTMYYAELEQKCDQAILQFVRKCKRENVPISNFHLSSGYTLSQNKLAPKRYVFTWNSKKFPNPAQFFQSMNELGVPVTPNVKPGLLTTHHLYQEFASNYAFIKNPDDLNVPYVDRWWGGDGSFVDFTDKRAREIWGKHLKEQLLDKGTTSIWNDNNQYQSIDNKGAICSADNPITQNKKFGIVDQYKSVQALMMAHTADQLIKETNPNVRPFIVTRSGCAGLQRYASTWSGDNYSCWKTLRSNISTVLNMGLSGIANYGCDVGGFWGPAPSAQLLLRWVQHGIFQPRFSIHSCNSDNTVTEPWMYPQYSALIAKTIRFRYVLLPYLYSLLYFSHIKGRPIMRPLVYQFQDSDFQACSEQTDEFMFGPYMLIANILQPLKHHPKSPQSQPTDLTKFPQISPLLPTCLQVPQSLSSHHHHFTHTHSHSHTTHSPNTDIGYKQIYLPKGCNWYSWNGGDKYVGGSRVVARVGMQSIPIFVKDRSIVPLAVRFGKGEFDMVDMNKQKVTGLYVKIAYDIDSIQKSNQWRTKNTLQFTIFQDNGLTPLTPSSQCQQKKQPSQRLIQNRLTPQIPPNSPYLLTKISVRHPETKQIPNPNILIIDIQRQGNIQDEDVCTIQMMVLEVKCLGKAPIWVTVGQGKCRGCLYQEDWVKWKAPVYEKIKGEHQQPQIQIDQPGCWYYDHQKSAILLKLHKNLIKPYSESHRNLQIRICKDKLIQFTKQYEKQPQEIDDNSQQTKPKDQVIVEQEEIEEIISGEEVRKVKERRRIVAKDNRY